MNLEKDPNKLEVYSETRRKRVLVGTLIRVRESNQFKFTYDRKYLDSSGAIPLGPELGFSRQVHASRKGALFPSFIERIPSQSNPAYEEYCRSQGIAPDEKNPIVLLTTIGRRGPSTFVFEPVPAVVSSSQDIAKFRKDLDIPLRDFSLAFDINLPTLQKLETGKSKSASLTKLIDVYRKFPAVALWQLEITGRKIHHDTLEKLQDYFQRMLDKSATNDGRSQIEAWRISVRKSRGERVDQR